MSIYFEWKKEYSVGVKKLDEQHKKLFDLGNEIRDAHEDDAEKYVLKMYDYVNKHFITEEAHMKVLGYPDRKKHIQLHNELLSALNKQAKNMTKNNFDQFKHFIYNWLLNHVLTEDKKYFEHAKT